MILTNSCYKHTEQGYEVSMNLAALEKSFIDQFIHGRPKIKLKLPVFKFHEDASIFDCIKQPKVSQWLLLLLLLLLLRTLDVIVINNYYNILYFMLLSIIIIIKKLL